MSELERVVDRGAVALGVQLSPEIRELIAARAGGDARSALTISRVATQTAAGGEVMEAHIDDAARKRPLLYDKGGDAHYDFTSAFIKSMRGSDPDAAVYYLAAMLEGGEDARFIARRMVVLARPRTSATPTRRRCWSQLRPRTRFEYVGLPEARLNLSQAAIYLALAPKSNASYVAIKEATQDVRAGGNVRPPKELRDASYRARRSSGTAPATSTPTTTPPASRSTTSRRSSSPRRE